MRRLISLVLAVGFVGTQANGADDLPPRAVARLGSHAFYHGPGIEFAVLSPDGKRAASAARVPSYFRHASEEQRDAYDRLIVVWDAANGERLREITAPLAPVMSLAFSPDGKQLAVSCGTSDKARVVVFAVESGKALKEFGPFDDTVRRLQFSASGDHLLASDAAPAVTTWDVAKGTRVEKRSPPEGPSAWVKDMEDTVEAVPAGDGKMLGWLFWQTPDYSKLPPGGVPPPVVPRPTILVVTAAGADEPLHRTVFDERRLHTFAFSPDGKTFFVGGDKASAHDTATGKELFHLDVASPYRIAPSADGRTLVTVTGQSQVRLWDLQTRKLRHDLYAGFRYVASDTLLAGQCFSADGKTLLLATDTTLRPFDTTTGKERPVAGHRAPVTPRFSTDGKTLFTTCDERRCAWDVSTDKKPSLTSDEPRKAWEGICGDKALAHTADGRLFLAGRDPVKVRDSSSGRVACELENSQGAFIGSFSPDGRRVLLRFGLSPDQDHARLGLYDAGTGKRSGEITDKDFVGEPDFSPDGRLVAFADHANGVVLHDGVTGKVVRTLRSTRPLPGDRCMFAQLHFSPDGRLLFASNYRKVREGEPDPVEKWEAYPTRVFDVGTGREVVRFYANPQELSRGVPHSCAACSPDKRLLAVVDQESATIRLLEIASGKVRVEFRGHRDGVHGLAFSPDGKTLASGGEDNVVFLWDVTGARTSAAKEPTDKELLTWWADLASDDARQAGAASASLIHAPAQALPLLGKRLLPAEKVDEDRLAKLIADLNADQFETRESAARELAILGERAEPALRQALKDGPALEVGRRLEALLDKLETRTLPPETLRDVRAVEVLEHLDAPDAVECLKGLAKGDPKARLTRDAGGALERLGKRR